jgi:hypothetical protein
MSKNYAVIQNDLVTNVIVADSLKSAKDLTGKECVECDGSFWIGWTLVDGVWIAPPKPIEEEIIE